jgi:hypothetical protein
MAIICQWFLIVEYLNADTFFYRVNVRQLFNKWLNAGIRALGMNILNILFYVFQNFMKILTINVVL